jgi:hypothetical protein
MVVTIPAPHERSNPKPFESSAAHRSTENCGFSSIEIFLLPFDMDYKRLVSASFSLTDLSCEVCCFANASNINEKEEKPIRVTGGEERNKPHF